MRAMRRSELPRVAPVEGILAWEKYAPLGARPRGEVRARGEERPKMERIKRDAEGHYTFEQGGDDFVFTPDDYEERQYETELDQDTEQEEEYDLMEQEAENPTDIEEPEDLRMSDENVYEEASREYFIGTDQMNDTEYGMTIGYDRGERVDECALCGRPIDYERGGIVETRIDGQWLHFCNYQHAARFYKMIGLDEDINKEL